MRTKQPVRELVPLEEDIFAATTSRNEEKTKNKKGKEALQLKKVTNEQRRRALEIVQAVTTMKAANSKTIRSKEFMTRYEQEVIDEFHTSPGISGDEKRHVQPVARKTFNGHNEHESAMELLKQ